MSRVLVTGGAGYIGSHTCIELMSAGHDVVVVDNLCNSKPESLHRVARIAGRPVAAFERIDVRDRAALKSVFSAHAIDAVIHFAGLKAVGESVVKPLEYYDNNVNGTVTLCGVMAEHGVKALAFSSSATVYGDPVSVPIREDFATGPTNPYGRSKWMVEHILRDICVADPEWRIALLRYFNPVGAHESGLIGEDPNGIPNNLMPFVSQVAVGKLERLSVFGGDWPTPDGTGVRDYIHVLDLAQGHVRAIDYLLRNQGLLTVNLGTGRGYSVLEVVRAFEVASGRSVPYRIVERRSGDIAQCYADPATANRLLGWAAQRDLAQMCADAWNWQSSNPQGYA
ncbi:MAG: UDP-glucose 4-epimerase GalE [Methyloversatilis sp.]|jgi:UDP-glucose 4-epimerase|nr:UDP-glucose 4-epimerase GalE [Methyloversatilis sp.]MBP6195653.1 UDP-glucose 4-epimerase GalE [Methyloversatilis sp.]MBP9118698.1 UDP-glucose 4-epimerase GalE [Methyloversatilis sp.]